MSNIYDISTELTREIRQLPAYIAAKESKMALDQAPESKQLLQDFLAFQESLQAQIQKGEMPGEGANATMTTFHQAIEKDPLVLDFFAKQDQLGIYIADIEKIIMEPVQDLLK